MCFVTAVWLNSKLCAIDVSHVSQKTCVNKWRLPFHQFHCTSYTALPSSGSSRQDNKYLVLRLTLIPKLINCKWFIRALLDSLTFCLVQVNVCVRITALPEVKVCIKWIRGCWSFALHVKHGISGWIRFYISAPNSTVNWMWLESNAIQEWCRLLGDGKTDISIKTCLTLR